MCSCEAYYPSLNALMPRNKRTVNPQSPVLKSVRSDWVGLALVVGRNESYESGLCEALYYTGRCALKPEHSLCIDWCGQSSWNSLLHEQGVEAQSFFWRFCTIEGSYRAWGGSEYSVWSGLTALILVIFTRNCRIALGGWGSHASSTKVGNFQERSLDAMNLLRLRHCDRQNSVNWDTERKKSWQQRPRGCKISWGGAVTKIRDDWGQVPLTSSIS